MENINIKICCNNMISAIKSKIIIINDCEFCLGGTEYQLKNPTEKFNTAIVKLYFCPWCGENLNVITVDIKQKIKEKENALGNDR